MNPAASGKPGTVNPYIETISNRREFARFIPREEAFVALPDSGRLGPIRDISLSGVGCEFMVNSSDREVSASETVTDVPADIFASNKSILLRKIPCRIAYDVCVDEDAPLYGRSVAKRRCGLRFEKLDENQKEQIARFLEHNTVGSA